MLYASTKKRCGISLQGVFGKTPEIKAEIKDVLAAVKIDAGVRPENLTVEQFVDLANAFHTLKNLI